MRKKLDITATSLLDKGSLSCEILSRHLMEVRNDGWNLFRANFVPTNAMETQSGFKVNVGKTDGDIKTLTPEAAN